jgi:hypothetical protein
MQVSNVKGIIGNGNILHRATDTPIRKLKPFLDLLAIFTDRQALFDVGG